MSRKIFLPRPEERNFSCLPAPVRYARCSVVLSCPFVLGFLQLFHLGSCIFISRGDADRSLKLASLVVVRCQPWIYLRVARRAGGRRLPGSFPATRCDGGYSRRPGPHRESPSCDTTLSGDS